MRLIFLWAFKGVKMLMLNKQLNRFTLQQGDVKRTYMVYAPSIIKGAAYPVVFMLLGVAGTALGASLRYGWKELANEEGLIVVFPQAWKVDPQKMISFSENPTIWNSYPGEMFHHRKDIDDVKYLKTVLHEVSQNYPVDLKRVYFTGFSNGASMVYRMAHELPNAIAAIAPVAGPMPIDDHPPNRIVPLLIMACEEDPLVPIKLLNKDLNKWKEWMGISGSPTRSWEEKNTTFKAWGPDLVYVVIHGQGHEWPGIPRTMSKSLAGPVVESINATKTIWNFLKTHSLQIK